MRVALAAFLSVAVVVALPQSVLAQFFSTCSSASQDELQRSINAHHEHTERLRNKYLTGWYHQGELRGDHEHVPLESVFRVLGSLSGNTAALFYALDNGIKRPAEEPRPFCAWLLLPDAPPLSVVSQISRAELVHIPSAIASSIQVLAASGSPPADSASPPELALQRASHVLLPGKIQDALIQRKVSRLLVIPSFDIGTVPFSALPIRDGKQLVDLASVTVLPGFAVFLSRPRPARHEFGQVLSVTGPLVGDSCSQAPPDDDASSWPGAAKVWRGHDRQAVLSYSDKADLIHVVAHGRADPDDPNDGSYLKLCDYKSDPLTGRFIGSQLRLSRRPLVVLSACQTGLGKMFEVANIGLARAWCEAGASNVLMSLWSIRRDHARELVAEFADGLKSAPPDVALREAMLRVRGRAGAHAVAQWAGLALFGAPEQ